ncbi:MAG: hypothetical protein AB7I38_11915 [Dehalococcoidia bacterium]
MISLVDLVATVPDPPPAVPIPELQNLANTIIGGMKWFGLVGGMVGILICAMQIMVGRRNRNQLASDGLSGVVWVIGGLSLLSLGGSFVSLFVH